MPLHLRFIADFAFIWKFSGGRLDWEYIAQTVEKAGIAAPFWNAVVVVHKLINPPGMDEILKEFYVNKITDNSFVDMTVSRLRDEHRSAELSWLVALTAEEKNPFKRFLKAIGVLFPPRSYMKEAYPQWTGFPWILLAYIARIFKAGLNLNLKNYIMAYRAGKMARRVVSLEGDRPRRD
jgi:hypothetical protein